MGDGDKIRPAGDRPSGSPPPPGPADPETAVAAAPAEPGGVVDPGTAGDSFALNVVGSYATNEKAFLALLKARGIELDKVLFRGFSESRLESVLYFGTDHPEKDSVYAYDPREFMGAEPGITQEVNPFGFEHIVIYDKSKLSRASEHDLYRFNEPGKKSEAVLLVIDLKRTEPIDRHRAPIPPPRSPSVEISLSLLPPADSRRLLDEGQILRLALRRESVAPRLIRYTHLGDVYDYEAPKFLPKLKEPGIRTWEDLKAFIETALFNAADGESIEVEIDQYLFPTLQPPATFLEEIHDLAKQNRLRPLTLVVNGDPMEPPVVYRFAEDGIHSSQTEEDASARAFWASPAIAPIVATFFEENPEQKSLFIALTVAHRKKSQTNLGKFLESVLLLFNASVGEDAQIPLDKRSEIFSRLEGLRQGMLQTVLKKMTPPPSMGGGGGEGDPETTLSPTLPRQGGGSNSLPPAAFYWDPVTTLLRHHPVNSDPKNCWYSIGAGQMIATFELTRKLIDLGVLPLDFRLIADNRSDSGVWELNEHGTRFQNLGTNQVNTPDRRQIYVLGSRQREEALLTYRPSVVLFNVKASDLPLIMRGRLLEIFRLIRPVMSMPVKAYGSEKLILFLEIYKQLKEIDPELAEHFYVMGGFFEAPKMLQGRRVDITIAGGSEEGLGILAHGLSPTPVDPITGKADWVFLNLKLIPSVEVAALTYCGGANKNFLTYRSGRLLMREVLALPANAPGPDKDRLGQRLEEEKRRNIEIGEETTARITGPYGISTYHLWSSFGVEQDFRNSMPPDLGDLYTIRDRLAPILASGDFTKLEGLIEEIRQGLGRGTRNPRDGYIDEILATAFARFQRDDLLPPGMTWATFYETYYPKQWQGTGAQEGRNGIGPIIRFAQRNRITLPREVYEAWNLYNSGAKIPEDLSEQSRVFPLPPDSVLFGAWGVGKSDLTGLVTFDPEEKTPHPLWGLPSGWVRRLARYLTRLNGTLAEAVTNAAMGEKLPDKEVIARSIAHLVGILRPLEESVGSYPEVTRRLLAIRERAEILVALFSQQPLSPERLVAALRAFKETVGKSLDVFVEAKTVTELLAHLRRVAMNLFRVELEIRRELKVKLGLGREAPKAKTVGAGLRPAQAPHDAGTTVAIGAVAATGGGAEEPNAPKAMLRGLEMFDGTAALELIPLSLRATSGSEAIRLKKSGGSTGLLRRPAGGGTPRNDDGGLRITLIHHATQRGLKEVAAFLARLSDEQVRRLVILTSPLPRREGAGGGWASLSRTNRLFATIASRIGAHDDLAKILSDGRGVVGSAKGSPVITVTVPAGVPAGANVLQLVK